LRLGQNQEALKYYQKSLEIALKLGDVEGEAISRDSIGNVYNKLGQYDNAVKYFNVAIKLSEAIEELEVRWRSQYGLGATLWNSGKPEEAVAHYQQAIETIEDLYSRTQGFKEEERSSMIGGKSFVYQEFIDLLLELHRKHPTKGYDKQAFVVSEKAKSRVFQDLMAKAGAKTVFAGDETFKKMIEKEQQLMAEVTKYRGLLTKELSKPEKQRSEEVINSLKEQRSKAEKTLQEHEKEIDAKYPRYADLKRPKPVNVEDLQSILKPGETVVSYAVGKDKTAIFVIGKNSFKLVEIGIGKKELVELAQKFRRGLDDVYELKDLEKFKPEVAYELYQKIFQPLVSDLKGAKKLYISADDALYTLPFEALVDGYDQKAFREAKKMSKSGEGAYLAEYSTLHYLIDTYTITYLPSASVLRSLRKYEKSGYGKWDKQLIAFADPIFSPEEATIEEEEKGVKSKGIQQKGMNKETELAMQILTRSTGGAELQRLKESADEAKAIAQAVKGKREDIFIREKATEDNVYKANLKDARYILFSTHGLSGGDFSGVAEPSLALTLIDNPPGRDGFLTMSEVLGLDLNTEMVILSACNTSGKGDKAGSGEGFAGLTRSFMYAGTRSILVTHWSVESQAARDLMVGAFRDMQKEAKPDALRDAKLKMKSSTRQLGKEKFSLSHPFFWAPFVLVGESE
jgi:CHAT domain-containing protein